MYTTVCSRALFPLHERLKGHDSVAVRQRLEVSQWWPREAIESDAGGAPARASCSMPARACPTTATCSRSTASTRDAVQSVADLRALPLLDQGRHPRPYRCA